MNLLLTPPPNLTPTPYQCPRAPPDPPIETRLAYENPQLQHSNQAFMPSVKVNGIEKPPPLDLQHLKLNANKKHNQSMSFSLDIKIPAMMKTDHTLK